MSVTAKKGDTVKVHYTGRLDENEVFDSSENREPLVFTIGSGEIIPGFEQAVIGMNPGDQKTVTIVSEEAYGPVMKELITEVDRSKIPPHIQLEEGQMLQIGEEGGPTAIVRVSRIDDKTVTLDANHPLAGRDLIFDIKLLEIV
ncbi:MAG: peptidylprolyl isomerase [Simkaniaceae bacterium]